MTCSLIKHEKWAYGVGPCSGFRVLAQKWTQKSLIWFQCKALLRKGAMDDAIKATEKDAPLRGQEKPYLNLDGHRDRKEIEAMDSKSRERMLESHVLRKWNFRESREDARVQGLWKGLVDYQVPTFNVQEKNGWGHIDILGMSELLVPFVVELKLHKVKVIELHRQRVENETVLRALFEALAYTIAVKTNWPRLRAELQANGIAVTPDMPSRWPVVLLAPDAYWKYWQSEHFFSEARDTIDDLVFLLDQYGFEVRFAGLTLNDAGLPLEVMDVTDRVLCRSS